MSESTFIRDVPDIKDIENRTGECPGFSARILKDDTYVGVTLLPIGDSDPRNTVGIALSRDDATAFLNGLQEAMKELKEE
jgi:hypothetical protein